MENQAMTKKVTTPRKPRATEKTTSSGVAERTAAARKHAAYTLESQPGFDYELAARITLILTDDKTPDSTLAAIRQAVNDLAATTGVDVAYPTVVSETVPAMLTAIADGETFNFEGSSAEEMRDRLLVLVGRADAGEELPEPNSPKTKPPLDYEAEGRAIRDILLSDEVSPQVKDFLQCYLSDFLASSGVIQKIDDQRIIDPKLLPLIYPVMRFRDGAGFSSLHLINAAAAALMDEDQQRIVFGLIEAAKEGVTH
jgi:hypothetical protein